MVAEKNCSDESFGIVRSVDSGDGAEAWVKLHQKYSQRTKSRMMRALGVHVPEGGEGVRAGAGDPLVEDEVETDDEGLVGSYSGAVEDGSLGKDVFQGDKARHRAELEHDRREVLRDEGEGGHVGHKRRAERGKSGAHGRGHR